MGCYFYQGLVSLTFRFLFGSIILMPVTLYKRQRQILDFINQYIQKFGVSPTLQQIADAIGVSSLATVHEHLANLEKKGVLRRYRGKVRGIEILDKDLIAAGGVNQGENECPARGWGIYYYF